MVADSVYRIQNRPLLTPNGGKNEEVVKTQDILNISAVVQEKYDGESPDSKMFPIVFKNIFQDYVMHGGRNDQGYSLRTHTFNTKGYLQPT